MVVILCGDDIFSLDKRLVELTFHKKITVLNGENLTTFDIENTFKSLELFSTEKNIIINNFLKIKKNDTEILLNCLSGLDKFTNVYLRQDGIISKTAVQKFKKFSIENYDLPKLFFKFLDNLNISSLLSELNTLSKITNMQDEQIFYGLIKRVRVLLYIKEKINSEEINSQNSWVLGKLKQQSANWNLEKIKELYLKLYEIEKGLKSGGLNLPLKKKLDILLISELH